MLNSYDIKSYRTTVLLEVLQGEQHGAEIHYYKGERILERSWKDGDQHGVEIHYHWINGEKHGEDIVHWESGDVRWVRSWKDGKKHGDEIGFWENGNIECKNWVDGKEMI